eukprot:scaffold122341_cov40-Attheya_sp.AAC.1
MSYGLELETLQYRVERTVTNALTLPNGPSMDDAIVRMSCVYRSHFVIEMKHHDSSSFGMNNLIQSQGMLFIHPGL